MRVKWWELIRFVITIGKLSKIIGLNRFFFMLFRNWSFFFLVCEEFYYLSTNTNAHTFWISSSFPHHFVQHFQNAFHPGNSRHCVRNGYKNWFFAFLLVVHLRIEHDKIANIMLNIEHWTHHSVHVPAFSMANTFVTRFFTIDISNIERWTSQWIRNLWTIVHELINQMKWQLMVRRTKIAKLLCTGEWTVNLKLILPLFFMM